MVEIKIGCDPEFFLLDGEEKPVSAHDMVPGTKEKPHKLDGGAVQADGTAVEFNIDPADTFMEFNDRINRVLEQIRGIVGPNYKFAFTPLIRYPKGYFHKLPREAKELGCDPDFNAVTGGQNPAPRSIETTKHVIRTAAGHVHIGWTNGIEDVFDDSHWFDCCLIVNELDRSLFRYLYTIETLVDPFGSRKRRDMYGQTGSFRPKPYGVEWRSPANTWVQFREGRNLLFYKTHEIFTHLLEGRRPMLRTPPGWSTDLIERTRIDI